ncbi:glycosyltransferase family 2 protein [Mycobacterium sp. WMMD1722]|uniref:glycosyltransferase family 2 protein n=1 Tax=Mycobacterium sp. WMMD1722 TaxID=3404117 RepID=UPI003BF4D49A
MSSDQRLSGPQSILEIGTVFFGGFETLAKTMPTWIASLDGSGIGLRIVDNGPTAQAERFVESLTAGSAVRLTYVRRPDNPGFATSANTLIREAESRWLFLLNPDVYLDRDSVGRIVDYATHAGPQSLAAVSLRTGSTLTSGVQLTWYGYFLDRGVPQRRCCLGPSGGAAVIPVKAARDNGWYFDEDLFAWGEDAGLAMRLSAAGVRTMELDLQLTHIGGHSVPSLAGQQFKARLLARNRLIILRRDFSKPYQFVVGPLMLLAMALNGVRKARQGTARAYILGIAEAVRTPQLQEVERPRLTLRQFVRYLFAGAL